MNNCVGCNSQIIDEQKFCYDCWCTEINNDYLELMYEEDRREWEREEAEQAIEDQLMNNSP